VEPDPVHVTEQRLRPGSEYVAEAKRCRTIGLACMWLVVNTATVQLCCPCLIVV
jgi:hypothetical protein